MKINALVVRTHLRKGKIVKIRYGCNSDPIEGYIGKGKVIEHIPAIPVHLKDGRINLGSARESKKDTQGTGNLHTPIQLQLDVR